LEGAFFSDFQRNEVNYTSLGEIWLNYEILKEISNEKIR
jgi:hypothetical protein